MRATRQVGNFPQAFSHVSLVNAAYNLSGHPGMEEQLLADERLLRVRADASVGPGRCTGWPGSRAGTGGSSLRPRPGTRGDGLNEDAHGARTVTGVVP